MIKLDEILTSVNAWRAQLRKEKTRAQVRLKVCLEFDCTIAQLTKPRGRGHVIDAKMVYAYLIRKHLKDTVTKIGKDLNLDHSSIVNLLKRMDDMICTRDYSYKKMEAIEQLIFLNHNPEQL